MNIEEQCLCNVKAKSDVDVDCNTTNTTEVIIPQNSVLTDSSTEKQNIAPIEGSETYLMPQLAENLQAADNHQAQNTLEIGEINGNRKSSVQATFEVVKSTDLILSNDEHHKDSIVVEKMKDDTEPAKFAVDERGDAGDMDMGVDLSLDDSGVLESESTNVRSLSEDGSVPDSTQNVPAGTAVESLFNASQTGDTELSATDQAGLYPLVEDGENKHKSSGKRVTFPSDEDIVSGAVEPKDPWRHGNAVCSTSSSLYELLSVLHL